jgi:hypothetical protein
MPRTPPSSVSPAPAVVFLYVDELHLPTTPTLLLRSRATLVRTVLPHSSVNALDFEPRGNVVSAATPPLLRCVMPAFVRLGRYLAGVTAVFPHARRCLSRFLVLWAVLPCAAAPVHYRSRAAGMRTPTRLGKPARHRTAVHPRTHARLPGA